MNTMAIRASMALRAGTTSMRKVTSNSKNVVRTFSSNITLTNTNTPAPFLYSKFLGLQDDESLDQLSPGQILSRMQTKGANKFGLRQSELNALCQSVKEGDERGGAMAIVGAGMFHERRIKVDARAAAGVVNAALRGGQEKLAAVALADSTSGLMAISVSMAGQTIAKYGRILSEIKDAEEKENGVKLVQKIVTKLEKRVKRSRGELKGPNQKLYLAAARAYHYAGDEKRARYLIDTHNLKEELVIKVVVEEVEEVEEGEGENSENLVEEDVVAKT